MMAFLKTVLLLAVLAVSVKAFPEQSVCTFSPIAPGHLHNDRFSVLNNDRTEVTAFVAPNFAAGVLDFRSLEAGQTVTLGLAGGIAFDSDTVAFVSGGAESFSSGTSLDINALLGSVNFEGSGDFQATASGGDLDLDSQNGNVNLLANNGALRIEGAQVFFDGKYETLGVDFATSNGGDITLRAGDLEEGSGFGNIDIKGSDVNMASSLLTLQSIESDLSVSTQGTQIFAGETASIGATNDIDITSDLSDILIDSGNDTSISGNTVSVVSSNRLIGRSIQDSVRVSTSGDIDLIAGDFTEVYATGDQVVARDLTDCFGATLLARDSIDVTAVQYIDIIATGSTVAVTAGEFDLISQRGNVVVGNEETPSVSMTASGAAEFDSSDDIFLHSLADTILRTDSGDLAIEASNQAKFSAVTEVDIDADTVAFSFDNYFGEFSGISLMFGEGVDITADDFVVAAGGNVDIDADGTGALNFVDFTAESTELLVWEADSIDMNISDDLTVDSDGNVIFSSADDTVSFSVVNNFGVDALRGANALHGGAITFVASQSSSTVDSEITSHGSFRHESDRDISLTAGVDLAIDVDEELTITNNVFTSLSADDTSLSAAGSVRIDAQDTVQFLSGGTGTTGIEVSANDDINIEGGEHYSFTAADITVSSDDVYLFARDEFNVNADVTLSVDSDGDVSLASKTYVAFTGEDLNWTVSNDVFLSADPRAGGEVRIRSETSSVSLTGGAYEFTAAQNVVTGGVVSVTAGNNIDITHTGPLDGIDFIVGGGMAYTGDSLDISGSEVDLQSVGDVTITAALETIDITTQNGDVFTATAEDNVTIAGDGVTFTDDFINIGFTVAADIESDLDTSINADDGVFFNAVGDINADFGGEVSLVTNADDVTVNGSSDISLIGASVEITGTTSVSMISGGGGHVFTAGNDISFTGDSSALVSTVEGTNTFVAQGGDIEATSDAGIFVNGGNSTYSAGGNVAISSQDSMRFATSQNDEITLQLSPGNILYHSGENYIETVESQWSVVSSGPMYPSGGSGNNPSNYGDGGGNGRIATTDVDADICLFTIPDDVSDTATFTFSAAESMLVSAFGPDGHIDLLADGALSFTSQQHSVGLSSFGFTTDPEFLLTDNLGVLFRASRDDATGEVSINSSADFSAFAQTSVSLEATNDQIGFAATENLFVRTTDLDADIALRAQTGSMTFTVSDDALLTTGTSTTIGNLNFNATSTTTWTVDDFTLNQLGANTNDIREGALFQAFGGDINFDIADNRDGLFSSVQDGGVHIVTENGNALITADDEVRLEASSGQVFLEGRTGGFLDTRPGTDITINSGKNVEFVTAGEEYLSIDALDTKLFFTATNGEVDVQATTGLFVNAASTLDLDGPCINFRGGGSVEFFSEADINLSSTDVMRFDADVEMTIDAATTFAVAADIVSLNAGGDESTTGVSLQSNGAVSFVTPLDMRIDALSTVIQADTTLSVTTVLDQTYTSTSASGTNDNLLVHSTDGNIDISAAATVQMQGTEEHTLTTSQVMLFDADTARLLSNRDIRMTVEGDMAVNGLGSITMNSAVGSWVSRDGESMTFDATDIVVDAESILTLTGSEGTFDALNAMSFSSTGTRAPVTFLASEDNLLLGTVGAGLTATTVTAPGLLDFDAPEAIDITSPVGGFTAARDILVKTFETASFGTTAATSLVSTARGDVNLVSDSASVSITTPDFITDPPRLSIDARDEISVSADAISFLPEGVDFVASSRSEDVVITADTSASILGERVTFTSNGDTENAEIVLEAPLIDYVVVEDITFNAEAGNVEFNTGAATLNVDQIEFSGNGIGGVNFEASTAFDANFDDITLITSAGRVYYEADQAINIVAFDSLEFQTSHYDGHINILGEQDVEFDATVGIVIGATEDADTRFGEGLIRFESEDNIDLDSPEIDVRSEHDLRFSGDAVTMSSGGSVEYLCSMTATFAGADSVLLSSTGDLDLATSQQDSEVIFSSHEIDLTTTAETWTVGDDARILASTRGTYSFANAGIQSGTTMLMQAGSDLAVVTGPLTVTATASDDGIRFENSDAGSRIDIRSGQVTYTATTGDMEFHAGDHIYAEIDTFTSAAEATIQSSNDVWMRASTFGITVNNDATFGTQGSGNYVVEASTHTITANDDILFESHGNLGGLGGRYVADHNYYVFGDQLASIADNFNAIEVHTVGADVEISAADDVFIESHGGSIEIKSQNDIHYSLSTASGNMGFYGILETNPAVGLWQQIGFTEENDYCETNFGIDRCNTNNVGTTCTVDCTFTSGAINDIADMLVA